MKMLLLCILLLAVPAFADTVTVVVVDNSTPTAMPTTTATTRRSVAIENTGPNNIYCSPSSSVTTSTGFLVEAGKWRSFPGVPIWCIAATAAQTGTGTNHTLVWESDS